MDWTPPRVPSLAEMLATPRSGLRVLSTFSGCGGSSLGLRWAGFDVLGASEFVEEARTTYLANFPGANVDARDIRAVRAEELLERFGLAVGELDLFEGSPPCASFSMSGSRHKKWGTSSTYSDTTQRTDDLFFEWLRLLDGLRPRAFVAENVTGMTRGKARGYLVAVLDKARALGYVAEARILDASWLGVAQSRRRVIFLGRRADVGRELIWPRPMVRRWSVAEALAGPPTIDVDDGVEQDCALRPALLADWQRRSSTRKRNGDYFFNMIRCEWDKPCPTIVAGCSSTAASVAHPSEPRKFRLWELRRLCGFPDDFKLTGTYWQRGERLGRAVPPPMMRAVGLCLRELLA